MATQQKQAGEEPQKGEEVAGKEAGKGPLQTERGRTTIDDGVVGKVAGMAAREVSGVYDMGAAPARAVGAMTQRVGITDQRSQGVSVEVGERQAAADVTIVVEYGESIPRVSQEVRDNVIRRIEGICGLEVTEVNISVDDLHFPGDEEQPQAEARLE